jgi:hypothetical protein
VHDAVMQCVKAVAGIPARSMAAVAARNAIGKPASRQSLIRSEVPGFAAPDPGASASG